MKINRQIIGSFIFIAFLVTVTGTALASDVNVEQVGHLGWVNGSAHDVSVSGNYAYVADASNGLVIVDISNQSSPVFKGSYKTTISDAVVDVSVSGNYAYVADANNGLLIGNYLA